MSGTSRKNSGSGSGGEAPKAPQPRRRKTQPLVKQGDIAPDLSPTGLRQYYVSEATAGAQEAKLAALKVIMDGPPPLNVSSEPVQAILAGGAPDDAAHLLNSLGQPAAKKELRRTSDELAERLADRRLSLQIQDASQGLGAIVCPAELPGLDRAQPDCLTRPSAKGPVSRWRVRQGEHPHAGGKPGWRPPARPAASQGNALRGRRAM